MRLTVISKGTSSPWIQSSIHISAVPGFSCVKRCCGTKSINQFDMTNKYFASCTKRITKTLTIKSGTQVGHKILGQRLGIDVEALSDWCMTDQYLQAAIFRSKSGLLKNEKKKESAFSDRGCYWPRKGKQRYVPDDKKAEYCASIYLYFLL